MDPASGEGEGRGWGGRRWRRGLFFILASSFPPHLRAAAARRAGPGCGGESSGPASRRGPAPTPSPRRRRAPAAGRPLPSRLAAFPKHRRGSAAGSGRAPSRAKGPRPGPAESPAARRSRGPAGRFLRGPCCPPRRPEELCGWDGAFLAECARA
ncbi:translation initiation factor IF-2-like [Trachypithecus francoisi]|uniref:translation initiation factor IF-2-like n=1 Tax=Trachypithecus francoisi TaxID=54180 RepID=UPI00141AF74D|nr:translation initiation factor IF-2-like [Trachypithecus francoisi]